MNIYNLISLCKFYFIFILVVPGLHCGAGALNSEGHENSFFSGLSRRIFMGKPCLAFFFFFNVPVILYMLVPGLKSHFQFIFIFQIPAQA